MPKILTVLFLVLCFYHKGFSQVINLSNVTKLIYYYVIDLKRSCGVLTGSLTLIR